MKKILEAYRQGTHEDDDDSVLEQPTRSRRLAYRLGRRSLAKTRAINQELDNLKQARFNEAAAAAKGNNKLAFSVLEQSAKIPHQAASRPKWGMEVTHPDGSRTVEWISSIRFGANQDPTRPRSTPLVDDIGVLHIDSSEWGHNGLNVPVDNMTVVCSSPIDAGGKIGPATSTVHFNTRPYEPMEIFSKKHAGVDFKDTARVDIGADGAISSIGVTHPRLNGFINVDPATANINLTQILQGAAVAAAQTARAYAPSTQL